MIRQALVQRVNASALPFEDPDTKNILNYLDCDNAPKYSQQVLKRLIVLTESQGKEVDGEIIATYAILIASHGGNAIEDGPVVYDLGQFKLSIEEDHDVLLRAGSTGYRTWEASLGAADYFLNNGLDYLATRRSVVELGSGTGLVGLILAKLGFDITLTDGDPSIIGRLEKTVESNQITNARCQLLDFYCAPEDLKPDLVVASDVLYDPSLFSGVLGCMKALGAPTIISTTLRNTDSYNEFLSMVSDSFEIEKLATYDPCTSSKYFWFPPGPPIEVAMFKPRENTMPKR